MPLCQQEWMISPLKGKPRYTCRKSGVSRLRETEHREHLRRDLTDGVRDWWNPFLAVSADDILLTYCPGALELEGKTLSAIAKDRNTDPIETVFDILIATEAQAIMVIFAFSDEDIRAFLRHLGS